jgi:folate-binding protein YgfZ
VGVRGRDAAEYLQRMVSNDVAGLAPGSSCEALLLTAKARVIAPLVVLRRAEDDFLLLTEPELGERVRAELLRSRFAAKATVEPEEHRSTLVLGGDPADGIPTLAYGEPAVEVVDAEVAGEPVPADELELLRIRARTPAWGREIDDRVMPAEAGLVEGAVSLTKGCYPGQEPIARLHYRGHANRSLRVLEIDSAEPPSYDAEVILDGKTVGRVTSAVREGDRVIALGYVRREVPDDASLSVEGAGARLH